MKWEGSPHCLERRVQRYHWVLRGTQIGGLMQCCAWIKQSELEEKHTVKWTYHHDNEVVHLYLFNQRLHEGVVIQKCPRVSSRSISYGDLHCSLGIRPFSRNKFRNGLVMDSFHDGRKRTGYNVEIAYISQSAGGSLGETPSGYVETKCLWKCTENRWRYHGLCFDKLLIVRDYNEGDCFSKIGTVLLGIEHIGRLDIS